MTASRRPDLEPDPHPPTPRSNDRGARSDGPAPDRAYGNLRIQRWLLRIAALVQFTGLPGALLPGEAIEKYSWLMGFGQPDLGPITIYLSGNAGYVFVAFGIVVWVISTDLVRYRPLVTLCGWIYLIAAPAYLSIDLQCPLPWWWVAMDSVSCLIIGAGILWACRPRHVGNAQAT